MASSVKQKGIRRGARVSFHVNTLTTRGAGEKTDEEEGNRREKKKDALIHPKGRLQS